MRIPGLVCLVACSLPPLLYAQHAPKTGTNQAVSAPPASTYTPHMTFDVASIRESREGHYSYYDNPPQTSYFHGERIAAAGLILTAYDLKFFQRLENVPEWALMTKYDVTAKSDESTDEALAKLNESDFRAEKHHMLRQLLADRFKLQIHPETRVSTTYELVATPAAAKLMTPVHGDISKTISSCNYEFSKKGIDIESKGCPFTILLGAIQQDLGTDVVDHTGLSGMYAFHLMWNPPSLRPEDGEERYPHIADALHEQLGLELKKTKGPVTFWVIDHIE